MDLLRFYLDEDQADRDITSHALFGADEQGAAAMLAREACFAAGLDVAVDVFGRLGAAAEVRIDAGSWVEAGDTLLEVQGPVRALLGAERVALNIVGRMSGIATQTRRLVEALVAAGSGARVAGTRKTTPGFRRYEKMAIEAAGGDPHRFDLAAEAMIKDNHRAAVGSVEAAVQAVRTAHPTTVITTEVESLDDALAAAHAGTDWILIDNQTPDIGRQWADAVREAHPGVKVEASGGIGPGDVVAYGWADRISLGWLTHHAVSIDVGLDWRHA